MEEITDWEFDVHNRAHLARHNIDDNLVMEVFLDRPCFAVNPPCEGRSGSHQMIGPSGRGKYWTIIITRVEDGPPGLWRAITGWPSTSKERRLYDEQA